jgi:REP element-mobilizing transposase RayT
LLKRDVWYEIRTVINNREQLFRLRQALALFAQVLGGTAERFNFEIRALRLQDDRLVFYIKPEDGLKLPRIMQWLKQTFAVRYNLLHGRSGHIWGDRYWSRILEAEPPDWAEEATGAVGGVVGAVPAPAGGGDSPQPEEAEDGVSDRMGVSPRTGKAEDGDSPLSGETEVRVRPRTENPPGHARSFARRNSGNNRVSGYSASPPGQTPASLRKPA